MLTIRIQMKYNYKSVSISIDSLTIITCLIPVGIMLCSGEHQSHQYPPMEGSLAVMLLANFTLFTNLLITFPFFICNHFGVFLH
jgi:hypothetical protein